MQPGESLLCLLYSGLQARMSLVKGLCPEAEPRSFSHGNLSGDFVSSHPIQCTSQCGWEKAPALERKQIQHWKIWVLVCWLVLWTPKLPEIKGTIRLEGLWPTLFEWGTLNVKCLPQAHMLETWLPSWNYGKWLYQWIHSLTDPQYGTERWTPSPLFICAYSWSTT